MSDEPNCLRCGHPDAEHRNRGCIHMFYWVPNGKGSPHSGCDCTRRGAEGRADAAAWNAYMGRG